MIAIIVFAAIYVFGAIASLWLLTIEAKKLRFDSVVFAVTWVIQVFIIIPLAWLVELWVDTRVTDE